jgi:hypothetical protein
MVPRRRSILFWVLVALVVLTVMQDLGGALRTMHSTGDVAGSITSIDKPLVSASDAKAVVAGWVKWGNQPRTHCREVCADPSVIAGGWLTLDSLFFAPLLAVVLALLAKRRLSFVNAASWIHEALTIAAWATLLYLALDETENLLTALFVFHGTASWLAVTIGWVTLAKTVSVILIAVPILASFAPTLRSLTRAALGAAPVAGESPVAVASPRLWPTVRALRVPAVLSLLSLAVMLELPAGVRPQLHDVIRTWFDANGWHALWAFAATLIFSLALYCACSIVSVRDATVSADNGLFLVHLVIALGAWAVYAIWRNGVVGPLAFAAAVLMSIGVVASLPSLVRNATRHREGTEINRAVARGFALAPLFGLGMLILGSTEFAGPGRESWIGGGIALLAFFLAALGWYGFRVIGSIGSSVSKWILGLAGAAAIAIAIVSRGHPLGVGWEVGSVAVLFVGLIAGLFLLVCVEQAMWRPPWGGLAALGIRRAPIFTMLLLALLLESHIETNDLFHPVHLEKGAVSGPSGTSAADAFGDYVHRPSAAAMTAKKVEPIFVIASSGGGGRAQYWTLLALNCLFADSPPDNYSPVPDAGTQPSTTFGCNRAANVQQSPRWGDVFIASGISGGSVGLAMFDAVNRGRAQAIRVDLAKVFDRGFLDPTFTSLMFGDLPNAFAHLARPRDRARVLEESWEDALPAMKVKVKSKGREKNVGRDFLAAQESGGKPTFPTLMLNSTDVDDGCRINVSALRLASPTVGPSVGPQGTCRSIDPFQPYAPPKYQPISGTRDVMDYVCSNRGDELSYATAALLSARFPFVSPSGALRRCDAPGSSKSKAHVIYAVDGGYLDSTAASPLVEVLSAVGIAPPGPPKPKLSVPTSSRKRPLAVCYQPVVLQIDNGYADSVAPVSPGRPRELIAPLHGKSAAASAHGDDAEQELAELATRPRCAHTPTGLPTYLHVVPQLHPGTTAPLGWSLSRTAARDMGDQLAVAENQLAICNARRWLVAAERNRHCSGEADKVAVSRASSTRLASARDFSGLLPVLASIAALLIAGFYLLRRLGDVHLLLASFRSGQAPPPPTWHRGERPKVSGRRGG